MLDKEMAIKVIATAFDKEPHEIRAVATVTRTAREMLNVTVDKENSQLSAYDYYVENNQRFTNVEREKLAKSILADNDNVYQSGYGYVYYKE